MTVTTDGLACMGAMDRRLNHRTLDEHNPAKDKDLGGTFACDSDQRVSPPDRRREI
ncbi:MAG: hypothetical protein ACM37Z_13085 [Deltaproteobacteria bacterium]